MACIRWSYDSRYFRGLCSNKLEAETGNTTATCSVCVTPVEVEETPSSSDSGQLSSTGGVE
jgi:hypothetical protein